MNKNQQLLLGVGVVGVAGYLYWKSKQAKASFASVSPRMRNLAGNAKSASLNGLRMNADGTRKIAGKVQQLGSNSFGKANFAEQKLSGDAKFAQAVGSINPVFHVEGAHVGTPTFWS
jgi:hypothetical protein|tara:strand:+ start:688 stop:1038 length:351 start_codon:yes stop_codon:yes gene_type:complete